LDTDLTKTRKLSGPPAKILLHCYREGYLHYYLAVILKSSK